MLIFTFLLDASFQNGYGQYRSTLESEKSLMSYTEFQCQVAVDMVAPYVACLQQGATL